MGMWRRWTALAVAVLTGSPAAATEYAREQAHARARRDARRRRRVPDDGVSWCANPPSMQDAEAPRTRDEFFGTASHPYPADAAGHDTSWKGTHFDPYSSVEEAGKRRR